MDHIELIVSFFTSIILLPLFAFYIYLLIRIVILINLAIKYIRLKISDIERKEK